MNRNNTTTGRAAVGYIRVSTDGQAADGVSLEAQRHGIAGWCSAKGYQLTAVHSDAGISGKKTQNRPGLQAALAEVCKARGVLVVHSLSRLARSVPDAFRIVELLSKRGADLASLSEALDTTSAMGRAFFGFVAVLSSLERELIGERTAAALAHKARKGERTGEIPYGWRLADDGVRLVPIETEQNVTRGIAALRAAGYSYERIARTLDADAVPTKKCRGHWTWQSVKSITDRARTLQTA